MTPGWPVLRQLAKFDTEKYPTVIFNYVGYFSVIKLGMYVFLCICIQICILNKIYKIVKKVLIAWFI